MGDAPAPSRFDEREQGVRDRLDDSGAREDARRRKALAQLDASLAAMAYPDYSGDVFMLIAQAKSIDSRTARDPEFPRQQHKAAAKLLAIYRELLKLAASAPRDSERHLLYRTFTGDLAPWDQSKPREVGDLAVFSRENLRRWSMIVDQPLPPEEPEGPRGTPRRQAVPKRAKAAPPKPQKLRLPGAPELDPRFMPSGFGDENIYPDLSKPAPKPPDPATLPAYLQMIKTPGMSYASAEGQAMVYAAVIRALLAQSISDERAREIVASIGELKDVSASRFSEFFDERPVGSVFIVTLQPTFFDKLAAVPEFMDYQRKPFPQRLQSRLSAVIVEQYPDFTAGERLFFAIKMMVDTASGFKGPEGFDLIPGRAYHDGWLFIGFLTPEGSNLLEPAFLMPDGRIFIAIEREMLLEAFRQGVLSASGAITLAYVEVALAAALVFAPEIIAFGAESLAAEGALLGEGLSLTGETLATWGARGVLGFEAALTQLPTYIVITGTSIYLWMGPNWERAWSVGQAGYNIIDRLAEKGVKRFFGDLVSGSPRDILLNWAQLLHDILEGYSGLHSRGGSPAPDEPEPPAPAAPRTASPAQHADIDPAIAVSGNRSGASSSQRPARPQAPEIPGSGDAPGQVPAAPVAKPPVDPTASNIAAVARVRQNQSQLAADHLDRRINPSSRPAQNVDQQSVIAPVKRTADGTVVVDIGGPGATSGALGTSAASQRQGSSGGGRLRSIPLQNGGGTGSSNRARVRGTVNTGTGGSASGRPQVANANEGDATAIPQRVPQKPPAGDVPPPVMPPGKPRPGAVGETAPGAGPQSSPAVTPKPGKPPPTPDDKADQQPTGTAARNIGRPGVPAPAPGGAGPDGGPRVTIDRRASVTRGLSENETNLVEEILSDYAIRMDKYKGTKVQADKASIEAHRGTQDRFTGPDYPQVVVEEPHGVTVGGKKTSNLKTSDLQINRAGADPKVEEGHIAALIELKRTAGIKDGDLIVKGRDFQRIMEFTNEQVNAYMIYATEKNVPVFVGDSAGNVYSPKLDGSGDWEKVGQRR